MSRLLELLIVALVFLVVGTAAGGYWGTHHSPTAVALRRTRQKICPSVPADTADEGVPQGLPRRDGPSQSGVAHLWYSKYYVHRRARSYPW